MKFILTKGEPYLQEVDILVRVYEAQCKTKEKEPCCGEVLFRSQFNCDPIRFTSRFPRGLVEGIKNAFKQINGNYTVQISNELPPLIGVLTSCDDNFDVRLHNEFLVGFPSSNNEKIRDNKQKTNFKANKAKENI